MGTTMWLMSCLLAAGQSANQSEWVVIPKLSRTQELVYRGTFTEESTGAGVECKRKEKIEARVFVLDTQAKGAEVALLTIFRPASVSKDRVEDPPCSSVRLELAHVDLQGTITIDSAPPPPVPLEGPPSLEYGAFIAVSKGRVGENESWEVSETGRPVQKWKASGKVLIGGMHCLKLVGVQQTEDWAKPRADLAAWRRTDTVWLAPRSGIAQQVERVIERRLPAREIATERFIVRYELASNLQYPGTLAEHRKREILMAHSLAEALPALTNMPTKHARQLEALNAKIELHVENAPPTPYREVLLNHKRRIEAALRGETPPMPLPETSGRVPEVAQIGLPAPDFAVPDFTSKEAVHPKRWRGKPVVLIFYKPASQTSDEMLHFAQKTYFAYRNQIFLVGLPMVEDAEAVRKQQTDFHLTFPLLRGSALQQSYAVEATPKLLVLDGKGIVRASFDGWGDETPGSLLAELKRCLEKK